MVRSRDIQLWAVQGRTGLLAFPERAQLMNFYLESFSAPLILFPLSWLSPCIERGRDWHKYLVLWFREWSRILLDERHSLFSDEVCGGYCASAAPYSRQSPALRTLAEERLESLLKFAPAVLLAVSESFLHPLVSPLIATMVLTGETPLFIFESPIVTSSAAWVHKWGSRWRNEWVSNRVHHTQKKGLRIEWKDWA